MARTIITEITELVAEGSDYLLTGTLYGPDGETPIEDVSIIASLVADLRDVENAAFIFEDRAVTGAFETGGAFEMPLSAADLAAVGALRFQRRLLTLVMTQTNGKKRNQAVKFTIENLQDAP